tara:strand:+ start:216 stop:341 length:126 start_codon:yes stop_codon:yes gene_type:complete
MNLGLLGIANRESSDPSQAFVYFIAQQLFGFLIRTPLLFTP